MSKAPPIPPDQRAGGRGPDPAQADDARIRGDAAKDRQGVNPDRQGQTGNTEINTHHQGHQQDR
ncbi:MAG: hypothetical protein JWP92_3136 [Caulobacter sp.]|nr:hypothetical protein [Caulobacter sp.]